MTKGYAKCKTMVELRCRHAVESDDLKNVFEHNGARYCSIPPFRRIEGHAIPNREYDEAPFVTEFYTKI